jgi:hypothetical protein
MVANTSPSPTPSHAEPARGGDLRRAGVDAAMLS